MVELIYIGKHQEYGKVIEVDEQKAEELVASKTFARKDNDKDKTIVISKYKENENPNPSWTEKKIKKWIDDNNIPIKYYVSTMTKETILLKLKDKGYL